MWGRGGRLVRKGQGIASFSGSFKEIPVPANFTEGPWKFADFESDAVSTDQEEVLPVTALANAFRYLKSLWVEFVIAHAGVCDSIQHELETLAIDQRSNVRVFF